MYTFILFCLRLPPCLYVAHIVCRTVRLREVRTDAILDMLGLRPVADMFVGRHISKGGLSGGELVGYDCLLLGELESEDGES